MVNVCASRACMRCQICNACSTQTDSPCPLLEQLLDFLGLLGHLLPRFAALRGDQPAPHVQVLRPSGVLPQLFLQSARMLDLGPWSNILATTRDSTTSKSTVRLCWRHERTAFMGVDRIWLWRVGLSRIPCGDTCAKHTSLEHDGSVIHRIRSCQPWMPMP